ncbi:branched-chain amino acid aminotransferase [Paenalkalicoccus suaedae]|uniref:Branched-chain-amino-acid aminotransferase n=1 Tax=Paenalkalicoccus suaedae TaxID=2592382 RepID=A0A859FE97_9BACI|nr:branched-chain amino acid aminotransferase [Paenalkalicoccus suaedae]QKS71231.1 branched-chain amino acid aminotransferase [Paenalkalicoccus suaedae]
MEATLAITEAVTKKPKPDPNSLQFGKTFTDHMFTMEYKADEGWTNPQIKPYAPIEIDPAAMVFHYSQTVFEGLKAYRTKDGVVRLFRPEENFKRLNRSNKRLSIPPIDEKSAIEHLKQLVALEKDWIPTEEGTSLYIRPFVIATEPSLQVAPAKSYQLFIILSPVGSYYPTGIQPVSIMVEEDTTRAVRGGTGSAKTGGNYSAGYNAQAKATANGHAQVLWLDGMEKKYIEEVGSMNVFFKINGEIVTPELSDSILEGITRKSVIELLKSWKVPVSERRVTMQEVKDAYDNGTLEEAFGSGTAAVISPIGELTWRDTTMTINGGETGDVTTSLYKTITNIQTGKERDPFGWTLKL